MQKFGTKKYELKGVYNLETDGNSLLEKHKYFIKEIMIINEGLNVLVVLMNLLVIYMWTMTFKALTIMYMVLRWMVRGKDPTTIK